MYVCMYVKHLPQVPLWRLAEVHTSSLKPEKKKEQKWVTNDGGSRDEGKIQFKSNR